MRLALLQLNPTIGDLAGNADRIERAVRALPAEVDLAITPEMSLTGYPPRDLLLEPGFVARSAELAALLARHLRDRCPVLLGVPERNPAPQGRPLFNAAALLEEGRIAYWVRKSLLPTYDVFDEDRYFEPVVWRADDTDRGAAGGPLDLRGRAWNDRDFWLKRRYHVDPSRSPTGPEPTSWSTCRRHRLPPASRTCVSGCCRASRASTTSSWPM